MKFMMPAMILLAVSMPTVWGDDAQQRKTDAGDVKVQVQVLDGADGALKIKGDSVEAKAFVMRIGPDGKVELKGELPPDVEKKFDEARAAWRADWSKQEANQGEKGPAPVVNGIDVGGSITAFGPGGVVYSQKFGAAGEASPDASDVGQLLEKALEAAGAKLPAATRQQLKAAFQQHAQAGGGHPAVQAADISSKLDHILARLEKIEQEIGRLHAAEKPKNE